MASLKLRVRAARGGPTVKVQVPQLCSLQGLKDAVAPLISLPPLSFSFSLNKKDAIDGPGTALLSSFGVTSGDLLYYLEGSGSGFAPAPVATSSQNAAVMEASSIRETFGSGGVISSASVGTVTTSDSPINATRVVDKQSLRELCASAATRRATLSHPKGVESSAECQHVQSPRLVTPSDSTVTSSFKENSQHAESGTGLETVEATTGGPNFDSFVGRRLRIPDLLQRVMCSEKGNVRQASSYLILAVHAVMLETGFVRRDPGGSASQGPELPPGWSSAGHVNLVYSLPELIISNSSGSGSALGQEALLRCQIVGNAVVVYGAVTGGSVHRLSLSVRQFVHEGAELRRTKHESVKQRDALVRDKNGEPDEREIANSSEGPGTSGFGEEEHVFRDIFELWKDVKDSLSLPLLTVICEKAGLPPPPSLLRLPTELKIKVLELLPATALASIACVSSELRFLAANEEFWKQLYRKEFGSAGERAPGGRGWKNAFVRDWEHRRRREEERREAERYFRNDVYPGGAILRAPPYAPHFGGLDYFQSMGGGLRGGFGGFGPDGGSGFRNYGSPGGLPGNSAPDFAGSRAVGSLDHGFGGSRNDIAFFPGMEQYMDGMVFDGQGLRTWPFPTSSPTRGTRAPGTYGNERVFNLQPRPRLDGEGDAGTFLGFGPYD